MSAASFLHSSFLQAISAVMLWPVHVQKVPEAPEHLCPVKLQTRCDICCACQSICAIIPTDSGVPRTVEYTIGIVPEELSLFAAAYRSPSCQYAIPQTRSGCTKRT